MTRLVDVFGGPECEYTYPNGDQVAYVCILYEARIVSGDPAPADGELAKCAWFTPRELASMRLGAMARAMLRRTGWLRAAKRPERAHDGGLEGRVGGRGSRHGEAR